MTGIVTVTAKNQVTLPVRLVELLRLEKGAKLLARVEGEELRLEKMGDRLGNLQGIAAGTTMAKRYSPDQVMKKALEREASRLRNET